jgi:hypothetical protein
MLKSQICCKDLEKQVIYNTKGVYENADIIVVCGKNDETDELTFLCHDKNTRKTTELDKCPWCKYIL